MLGRIEYSCLHPFLTSLKCLVGVSRYDLALSREQKNASGGKMYIQDRVEQYADEVFGKLDGGAHIYFCGLKVHFPNETETILPNPTPPVLKIFTS